MALDLRAIKEALANQIGTAIGASRPTVVRPFRNTPSVKPCITMDVTDITYFESMGPNGYAQVNLTLKVWTDAAMQDSAEIALDAYMSVGTGNPASIADAVNASVTLGGVVESCVVLEVGAPFDEGSSLCAEFPLKILTRKAGAQA